MSSFYTRQGHPGVCCSSRTGWTLDSKGSKHRDLQTGSIADATRLYLDRGKGEARQDRKGETLPVMLGGHGRGRGRRAQEEAPPGAGRRGGQGKVEEDRAVGGGLRWRSVGERGKEKWKEVLSSLKDVGERRRRELGCLSA